MSQICEKIFRKFRLLCAAFCTLLPSGLTHAEVIVDVSLPPTVAALVNGEPISRPLVDKFFKNDREALSLDPATDAGRQTLAELPAHILGELVDRLLIGQGARERHVAASDADLAAAEREMIAFCGSDARYDVYVAQNGFTRAEYREAVLRTKLDGQAMIKSLTESLDLPDDDVRAYYDAHAADADLQWPERVRGAHILFKTQPGVLTAIVQRRDGLTPDTPEMAAAVAKETDARQRLAESVRTRALTPGADFAVLAKEYSEDVGTREQGGDLGTFAHGVHPAALDDAFFKLEVNGTGPVVRTDLGFHVIRAASHLPAGRRTLEESTPEIRRRLLQQKSAKLLRDWLTNRRAAANIVVHDAKDLP